MCIYIYIYIYIFIYIYNASHRESIIYSLRICINIYGIAIELRNITQSLRQSCFSVTSDLDIGTDVILSLASSHNQ